MMTTMTTMKAGKSKISMSTRMTKVSTPPSIQRQKRKKTTGNISNQWKQNSLASSCLIPSSLTYENPILKCEWTLKRSICISNPHVGYWPIITVDCRTIDYLEWSKRVINSEALFLLLSIEHAAIESSLPLVSHPFVVNRKEIILSFPSRSMWMFMSSKP